MKNSAISISTIIAILMAILCMFSCSRHSAHWNTLRHADACMEVHPDSALCLVLEKVDTSKSTFSRTRQKQMNAPPDANTPRGRS